MSILAFTLDDFLSEGWKPASLWAFLFMLLGILLPYLFGYISRQFSRGPLTGWWWQIAYRAASTDLADNDPSLIGASPIVPKEIAQSPSHEAAEEEADFEAGGPNQPSTDPWSIELLRMKHGSKGSFRGKMWRIYSDEEREAFDRVWTSSGVALGDVVDGAYKRKRGTVKHGVFQMDTKTIEVDYRGRSSQLNKDDRPARWVYAPVQWLKVGPPTHELAVNSFVTEAILLKGSTHWPLRVRYRLRNRFRHRGPRWWFVLNGPGWGYKVPGWASRLAYVGITAGDPTAALNWEAQKRNWDAEESQDNGPSQSAS